MGMDLSGGYGAAAAAATLRDLLAQRFQARAYQDQLNQRQFENSIQERTLQQNEELKRAQLEAMAEARRGALEEKQNARAEHLANDLPEGFLQADNPAIPVMQKGGYGSLLTQAPATQPMGPDFVGPMPNFETPQQAQVGRPAGMLKTKSQKQIDTEAAQQQKADAAAAAAAAKTAIETETARHHRAMENKPPTLSTVTIQTVDANGNPVTRVVPKSEAVGKEFAGRPSATTANRADSAMAVKQTGEDIIAKLSDPKVAAMVGPAMGRYNSLREFIGNPPPELSELAGQIESYALANMGVHGMRSAQGAKQIQDLLDRKHTPESLKATIQGLNGFSQHFLENAGRKPAAGSGKIRARDPQGGLHEAPTGTPLPEGWVLEK